MGLADLHIHTVYSYDGTASISAVLKYAADYAALDVIAITDHDSIEGVNEALELAPSYGIEVIPGSEVSTADGHLLALFIDRPIPAGLPLYETVMRIGELGGICVAAHPTARGTSSLRFEKIHEVLQKPEIRKFLVGVEAFNGGLVYTRSNPLVELQARLLPLAQVGNSDAHVIQAIGQGATEFAGRTAADLRLALETGATKVRKGHGLDGWAVLRRYIPYYLMRKLGWVVYNPHPRATFTYARLSQVRGYQQSLVA
ncbi:MAG: PHP domain-containing protein [Anaerolineales bacterium]|jgi:predicted metal-dependent phosphoesterase TrpH